MFFCMAEYCDTLQTEREGQQGIQSMPKRESYITSTRLSDSCCSTFSVLYPHMSRVLNAQNHVCEYDFVNHNLWIIMLDTPITTGTVFFGGAGHS
jgi:hypothetical protein